LIVSILIGPHWSDQPQVVASSGKLVNNDRHSSSTFRNMLPSAHATGAIGLGFHENV
jgi:hypothetical protein